MVFVIISFKRRRMELVFVWFLGSGEGLGLVVDIVTLFDMTKRCGGE